ISGVRQTISEDTELLFGLGLAGQLQGWAVDLSASRFDVLDAETRQSDNFDTTTGLAPLTGQVTVGDDVAWNSVEAIGTRRFGAHAIATGFSYARYEFETPRFNSSDWRAGVQGDLRDASAGETSLFGVFIEEAITLSPRWLATLGLRAEYWEAQNGSLTNGMTTVNYASRSEEAFSPKAALTYTHVPDWSFTASAALATRFPTVQELYQADLISFGPNVGDLDFGSFNPDLKPEEALDLQLNATKSFDKASITVSLFRQDVEDTLFVQTVPELGESVTTNIDNVTTDGIDFIVATEDLGIKGLAIDANLSLLDAEITENSIDPSLEGNRFPRVPDIRANANVRYRPTENWLLAAGWRYQDTPDRNIENSATSQCGTFFCVSSFSFVDLKASYQYEKATISLGVDNVTDERAFVFHPYPSRTVLLELSWDTGR
ncbi:MAG: TonB-dependent receptor, partial [Pseudomonadota bacterium]